MSINLFRELRILMSCIVFLYHHICAAVTIQMSQKWHLTSVIASGLNTYLGCNGEGAAAAAGVYVSISYTPAWCIWSAALATYVETRDLGSTWKEDSIVKD